MRPQDRKIIGRFMRMILSLTFMILIHLPISRNIIEKAEESKDALQKDIAEWYKNSGITNL